MNIGSGTFRTVLCDPPWAEHGGGKIKRGADRHYQLMKTREIEDLARISRPVGAGLWDFEPGPLAKAIAPDAHLYLWVTNNFLRDGLDVMEAWGFRYVTKITWAKGKILPELRCGRCEGRPAGHVDLEHAGLGQYFRGLTEDCLFGVRGKVEYRTTPEGKRAQGTTLIVAPRGEHSEKPSAMRTVIERVSHGPYLELFARAAAPGWSRWGNEAPEGPGLVLA